MEKQEQLIIALMNEPTISQVAKRLKVNESTIFRMMQDESFKVKYREARRQLLYNSISQLQAISGEAVQTLRTIMNDGEVSPAVRVSAAKSILDMSLKAAEVEEIAERVDRIEEEIQRKGVRFA